MGSRSDDLDRPNEYQHPLQRFRKLMPRRVNRLLLVASRYDSFLLEEDGRLSDLILTEFVDLNLGTTPWMTRVSSGEQALLTATRRRFDLVLVTRHVRDMDAMEFARRLTERKPQLPIVPLAFDHRELDEFRAHEDIHRYERPFLWQGDSEILLGIVQSLEDRWNVEHDTKRVGVSSVILIEDSVQFYSSFLPMLYHELMQQSQRVISEGVNLQNKLMRMRARPKILHCTTYDEAEHYYHRYRRFVLGIISDINFPRDGKSSARAGLDFARMVRSHDEDLPIMLQTRELGLDAEAEELKAAISQKGSRMLLRELSSFMRYNFGFGDFIFQAGDGSQVGHARDLRELEACISEVPDECIERHAERNHFSTWLRARTEFGLAEDLRWRKRSDFRSTAQLRRFLAESLARFRQERQVGIVSVFDPLNFQPETSFSRLGKGSLGGKARGLAFVRTLLNNFQMRKRFLPQVEIAVPSAVVLATEVFDQFLEHNELHDWALEATDDEAIRKRFLECRFPEHIYNDLLSFLDLAKYPLAVRSSSLLEDSQYFPFTGVYQTYMVPNSHPDRAVRVKELMLAIKRVYASTFFQRAKAYIMTTPYRLEEEKMAVIIQRVAGIRHATRFYPDFAGVARSYNFYPMPPMEPSDGVVSVAMGFGQTVVEGGRSVSFSPRYPRHPIHFSTRDAILRNAQTTFFALDIEEADSSPDPTAELELSSYGIPEALEDGVLARLGSIYSSENDTIYDGLGREGAPIVTFAPILKHNLFPLAEITRILLEIGTMALNMPVEIEFSVNLSVPAGQPAEFAFLQMRPFVFDLDRIVEIKDAPRSDQICFSSTILGNGRWDDIQDLIVVDRDRFDRAHSQEVARQVAQLNQKLVKKGVPYILIGVGRWGAADPWLGIPITWEQISGARVIVESDFKDMCVTPSQGSHFFQNLTSHGIGYFTVNGASERSFVDWDWLQSQPVITEIGVVRHVRLDEPAPVFMDGRRGCGAILRPDASVLRDDEP